MNITESQKELKPYFDTYRRSCMVVGIESLTFDEWLEIVEEHDLKIDSAEEGWDEDTCFLQFEDPYEQD